MSNVLLALVQTHPQGVLTSEAVRLTGKTRASVSSALARLKRKRLIDGEPNNVGKTEFLWFIPEPPENC